MPLQWPKNTIKKSKTKPTNQMNGFIQKAAEILGIATDRVSQMTEHETRQLESAGQQISTLETEKEDAFAKIILLENEINAKKQELEAKENELAIANEALQVSEQSVQEKNSSIEELSNTIAQKDAKIAELEQTIANLPGAADTKVKAGDEPLPSNVNADKNPKYWTSADAELAAFQSKFKKKTTK